jgi:hypothetical protein
VECGRRAGDSSPDFYRRPGGSLSAFLRQAHLFGRFDSGQGRRYGQCFPGEVEDP